VAEVDTVLTRERARVCLSCAASTVGRKRQAREVAFTPGLLDPELNAAQWERAWSARRRRGPVLNELQQAFVDAVGPLTRAEVWWVALATAVAAGDMPGLERALALGRNVIVVKVPTAS
jgi:hypothetical protein